MPINSKKNLWFARQQHLSTAFLKEIKTVRAAVRAEMVTRGLALSLFEKVGTVLDVGGGGGLNAVRLARLGHQITVVDPDPTMLEAARYLISLQPEVIRNRIRLLECGVEAVGSKNFDVVCCHSVLIYFRSVELILEEMAKATRPGGLISIVSLNDTGIAFRSGIARRWKEAYADLISGAQTGDRYAEVCVHAITKIQATLEARDFSQFCWRGIGIFSDHLEDEWFEPDMDALCELEWLAGAHETYRQTARNFHLIARKSIT